uniref:Uncharacterized protein n=1 Tax=Romanomermis culicivorax TaxID=13658 RepID=A0A915IUD2_ROMCU
MGFLHAFPIEQQWATALGPTIDGNCSKNDKKLSFLIDSGFSGWTFQAIGDPFPSILSKKASFCQKRHDGTLSAALQTSDPMNDAMIAVINSTWITVVPKCLSSTCTKIKSYDFAGKQVTARVINEFMSDPNDHWSL